MSLRQTRTFIYFISKNILFYLVFFEISFHCAVLADPKLSAYARLTSDSQRSSCLPLLTTPCLFIVIIIMIFVFICFVCLCVCVRETDKRGSNHERGRQRYTDNDIACLPCYINNEMN